MVIGYLKTTLHLTSSLHYSFALLGNQRGRWMEMIGFSASPLPQHGDHTPLSTLSQLLIRKDILFVNTLEPTIKGHPK